jgi:hypothetical protein
VVGVALDTVYETLQFGGRPKGGAAGGGHGHQEDKDVLTHNRSVFSPSNIQKICQGHTPSTIAALISSLRLMVRAVRMVGSQGVSYPAEQSPVTPLSRR